MQRYFDLVAKIEKSLKVLKKTSPYLFNFICVEFETRYRSEGA
jgi:hypothetical protein